MAIKRLSQKVQGFVKEVRRSNQVLPEEREALRMMTPGPGFGPPPPKDAPFFLAEAMPDYVSLVKTRAFARMLGQLEGVVPRWITLPISAQSAGRKGYQRLTGQLLYSSRSDAKWLALYREAVGGELAWRNSDVASAGDQSARGATIMAGIRSKEDLADLYIDGLEVGDLIYDSYLRYKPAATVDLADPFLLHLVRSTLEVMANCKAYLDRHTPAFLLSPCSAYIQHGIVLRECLRRGIPVYCYGIYRYTLKRALPNLPRIRQDYPEYPAIFKQLPDSEAARAEGTRQLESRFTGQIDIATTYVRMSAYSQTAELPPELNRDDKRPIAMVFLHCFFDSPHIYRDMLFPDFYEWIHFILSHASTSTCRFVVKPHPSSLPANTRVVEELKAKYPHIDFISPATSNLLLMKAGIVAAFTVYGTIGHEMPWFGIPVCNAGDHPHAAYDFCQTPASREELARYVEDPGSLPRPGPEARAQIAEFYYMHNLHNLPGKERMGNVYGIDDFKGSDLEPAILNWHVTHAPADMYDRLRVTWDEVKINGKGT